MEGPWYKGVLPTYNSSISTCNMCMSYIAMWNFKTHHVACSDWVFGLSLLQLPPLTLQCISVLNESWACLTSCYYNHSGFLFKLLIVWQEAQSEKEIERMLRCRKDQTGWEHLRRHYIDYDWLKGDSQGSFSAPSTPCERTWKMRIKFSSPG